jgi:hypothetical protein
MLDLNFFKNWYEHKNGTVGEWVASKMQEKEKRAIGENMFEITYRHI